ncbi:uncharacterized protein O3C94_017929 [Discoglossus pictus]
MDGLIQVLLLLCLTTEVRGKGKEDANPLLSIKYGQLRGKTVTVKETEQTVHAFFGIPFAKPPVGPLRFAPPQPSEPWKSLRNATQQPPICLQNVASTERINEFFRANVEIPPVSEDCLYLNVFTPANREKQSKLPVMVFIHGGGLVIGGAFFFDGSALSAHENVVIVSIQYRLGIIGFFSTGDEEAPGNYGFLDQVAALQWVQENIEDFGGDPQSVTIFGESAGGVSVAAHVLSPLSKGLFHRAISESGVALMPALVNTNAEDAINLQMFIAKLSGCDSPDSKTRLDCMRRKSEGEVMAMSSVPQLAFIPARVDGAFLPKSPEELLAAKENHRIPYIIGTNNQEFGWCSLLYLNLKHLTNGMDKDTVQSLLSFPLFGIHSKYIPLIMSEYFGDIDDPVEIRNRFIDLGGDLIFVLPSLKTAQYHRDAGLPVYYYEFQHRSSLFDDYKPAFVKADHGDELILVSGGPFLDENVMYSGPATDQEKVLSRTLMRYWANFARNGDPNGPGLAEWPEYGKEENYLAINLKQKAAKKLIAQRAKFWTHTLPKKFQKMQEEKGEHTELCHSGTLCRNLSLHSGALCCALSHHSGALCRTLSRHSGALCRALSRHSGALCRALSRHSGALCRALSRHSGALCRALSRHSGALCRALSHMDFLIRIIFLLCLTLEVRGTGPEDTNPILVTKNGQLRGKSVKVKETDRDVHAFYGIPFAKPPVGLLRFTPPQPAEPWSGVRDATQHPPMCLQNLASTEKLKELLLSNATIPPISENCLFLNVFAPANRENNSKLPVMAFIHGGGLVEGGASLYDGSALSAYENIVTVFIQYRLGILGFFSTGDEQAPGNYGLLDQVAALQWVQGNIKDFGGDPESVTIFGESAGGLSVATHVLSPLSKGLFHKAISESGVALLPGFLISKAEEFTFVRNVVANISGCDSSDSSALLDCLKEKTEEDFTAFAVEKAIIPACVDGVFISKSAEEILINNESNRVPFMLGVNNHEFGWLIPLSLNISGFADGMEKDAVQSVLHKLPIFSITSEFFNSVMDEYFGDTEDPKEIRNRFIDFLGDLAFVIPAIKTANYHRDSGLPVYFYEFQHRPSLFTESKPDFVKSDHGDELFSVLGSPFMSEDEILKYAATEEEKTLSKTVMKYWANFARNGDPNGPGLPKWPEYNNEEEYLEVNLKQKSAKKLKEQRVKFWAITLPEKLQKLQEANGPHKEL